MLLVGFIGGRSRRGLVAGTDAGGHGRAGRQHHSARSQAPAGVVAGAGGGVSAGPGRREMTATGFGLGFGSDSPSGLDRRAGVVETGRCRRRSGFCPPAALGPDDEYADCPPCRPERSRPVSSGTAGGRQVERAGVRAVPRRVPGRGPPQQRPDPRAALVPGIVSRLSLSPGNRSCRAASGRVESLGRAGVSGPVRRPGHGPPVRRGHQRAVRPTAPADLQRRSARCCIGPGKRSATRRPACWPRPARSSGN